MRKIPFIIGGLILFLMAACGEQAGPGNVSGTVNKLDRMALPPDATVTVELYEMTSPEAQASVIGLQSIKLDGRQLPIGYEIAYDEKTINKQALYSVQSKITDGSGKLIYVSNDIKPVITSGNPTSGVEIMVVQVTATPDSLVSGTVNKLDSSALSPEAVMEVSLLDISLADAPAEVVNVTSTALEGAQLPAPFDIPYEPETIIANHTYSVSVIILVANEVLYRSTQAYLVITNGNPTSGIEVMVDRMDTITPTNTPLPPTSAPTNTPEPPTPTITQAPPTPPPGDPATTLGDPTWKDTFKSSTSGNWTLFDFDCFTSEIVDGKYVMTGHGAGYVCWEFTWPKVANFYLETLVQPVDACPNGNKYGLIFRSPENNSGYIFGITCDREYVLWVWDGKTGELLVKPVYSDTIIPGVNAVNRIGVMAEGKLLSLYINGVLVNSIENNLFKEGKFGTAILAETDQPFTVYYDDMKMWELP